MEHISSPVREIPDSLYNPLTKPPSLVVIVEK